MVCVAVRSAMIASALRFFAAARAVVSICPRGAAAACSFMMSVEAWEDSSLDWVRRARIVSTSSSSSARYVPCSVRCIKVPAQRGCIKVRRAYLECEYANVLLRAEELMKRDVNHGVVD